MMYIPTPHSRSTETCLAEDDRICSFLYIYLLQVFVLIFFFFARHKLYKLYDLYDEYELYELYELYKVFAI